MENNKDKPYSLQDAKTRLNKKLFCSLYNKIEELRKENESNKVALTLSRELNKINKYEIERLKESNKELVEALKKIYGLSEYDHNHDNILYNYQSIHRFCEELLKSEGDLLKIIIDKSKELDAEQKSHMVTNTDQLRINAMGKSEGEIKK